MEESGAGVLGAESRRIADELDAVLRDEDLWIAIKTFAGGGRSRDELARRAIRLYGLTAPILAQVFAEPAGPIAYALGALRDVADSCAILTRRWSTSERATLPLTYRCDVEATVRQFGLAQWASSHGVELRLSGVPADEVPSAWVGDAASWDDFSEQGLSTRWSSTVRTFRTAVRIRSTGDAEARTALQGRGPQEGAASVISVSRMWLAWARQFSETDLISVGVSQLLAAQGFFVVCWDRDHQGGFFPDDDFLRRFLQLEGGVLWLRNHGADLPVEVHALPSQE